MKLINLLNVLQSVDHCYCLIPNSDLFVFVLNLVRQTEAFDKQEK